MQAEKGTRFGEYEIVSRLGEGGMGAVYLARDHRLKRDVAIKVLTGSALARETEQQRLLQEARSAARLNHPHICTVHEVVTLDEASFIVMELVEGRPLSALIPAGGMPADSVARYGGQIADALAHAHERGIIHRDLKSSNVMVTPDGRVKVLDFGVAASLHGSTNEDTTLEAAWGGGTPGTLAYMAPELLNGEPATALSDIWALGVVLYEMTAGRRPFAERTSAAMAAAILQAPLPPLAETVPVALRTVVQRCLARVPGERYQQPSEVRAALDVVRDTHIQPTDRPTMTGPRRQFDRRLLRAAAVLLLAALAGTAAWRLRPRESAFLVSSQRPIGAFGASSRQATLSPDGGFIAFADADTSVSQIWIKNLAQGDPVQITSGDVPASQPAWSPKNDQIVFVRRGQGLWSVPPLGGAARRIVEFGGNPQFSIDGERLVFERGGREIWTARADGSEARRVEGVPTSWYGVPLEPTFSPDGSAIAFFRSELGPNGDLWIVPSAGGAARQLTHDLTEGGGPVWTKDGRFIVYSSMRGGSRTLWRVGVDGGTPEPVTAGAGEDLEPALSRDGRTLVYTNVRNQWALRARNIVTGAERVIAERRRATIFPRISPDGSRVAFFGFGDVGDVQIFLAAMRGGSVEQLTHGRGRINTMPRWSGDGSLVYFYENRARHIVSKHSSHRWREPRSPALEVGEPYVRGIQPRRIAPRLLSAGGARRRTDRRTDADPGHEIGSGTSAPAADCPAALVTRRPNDHRPHRGWTAGRCRVPDRWQRMPPAGARASPRLVAGWIADPVPTRYGEPCGEGVVVDDAGRRRHPQGVRTDGPVPRDRRDVRRLARRRDRLERVPRGTPRAVAGERAAVI